MSARQVESCSYCAPSPCSGGVAPERAGGAALGGAARAAAAAGVRGVALREPVKAGVGADEKARDAVHGAGALEENPRLFALAHFPDLGGTGGLAHGAAAGGGAFEQFFPR